MRLLRKNPAECIEMDGDHVILRADDPCDYSYAYTCAAFATGLARYCKRARRCVRYGPTCHHAPGPIRENLQLSEDMKVGLRGAYRMRRSHLPPTSGDQSE